MHIQTDSRTHPRRHDRNDPHRGRARVKLLDAPDYLSVGVYDDRVLRRTANAHPAAHLHRLTNGAGLFSGRWQNESRSGNFVRGDERLGPPVAAVFLDLPRSLLRRT